VLAAKLSAINVKVNSASGGATPLDWGGLAGLTLTATDTFALSGTVDVLSLADVITGSGSFSVEKRIANRAGKDHLKVRVARGGTVCSARLAV